MIQMERIRDAYDAVAEKYAKARDQASSIPYLERLGRELAPSSLILDLGCGAGLPVDRWLIDAGHRVIGLDISESMLGLARLNVPEAHYELGDIGNLETLKFSVDAVVCFFALFHIDRAQHGRVLKTIRTFLDHSGMLLITTGRTDWEGEEDFLGTGMSWSHYDGPTYRHLLQESGFEIEMEDEHRGNSFGDDDWHPIFLARAI